MGLLEIVLWVPAFLFLIGGAIFLGGAILGDGSPGRKQ